MLVYDAYVRGHVVLEVLLNALDDEHEAHARAYYEHQQPEELEATAVVLGEDGRERVDIQGAKLSLELVALTFVFGLHFVNHLFCHVFFNFFCFVFFSSPSSSLSLTNF